MSDAARTPPTAGQRLFLTHLLQVLAERLRPADLDALARDLARARARLLDDWCPLSTRAQAAAEMLREFGGSAVVAVHPSGLAVRYDACPLAATPAAPPWACRAVERMVAEVADRPVRRVCVRDGGHCCTFLIPTDDAGADGPAATDRSSFDASTFDASMRDRPPVGAAPAVSRDARAAPGG